MNQKEKTIIIAEAGVNHNGSPETAFRLAEEAARAGADYVKFQTFRADRLVTAASRTAEYQQRNCQAESQLEMLRRLELSDEDFIRLARHCREIGIKFLSTPFDCESVGFLADLGIDMMKVPSGEITNLPYLRAIGATKLPVAMSTGISTLADIESAINALTDAGTPRDMITLLHCNTEYPTPFADVNLRAMLTLREAFGLPAGYSDHTAGIEVPVAATALGATMIEKHFTLDKSAAGPDHAASLDPAELAAMVKAVRNVDSALGSRIKTPSPSEMKNIAVARKSIVAAKKIKKGETLTDSNLTAKRPGDGLSPMLWDMVVGTAAVRDFMPDDQIIL